MALCFDEVVIESYEVSMNKLNVMCIGAQKSGTTSLHNILLKHPEIELSYIKELFYFSDDRLYGDLRKLNRHYRFDPSKKVYMNVTPNYICHELALSRIKEYNPDMKLIVILRNPIDRLYSQYTMAKRLNNTNKPFSDFFVSEKDKLEKKITCGCYNAIYRSLYCLQLDKVYQYFDQSQVLIVSFDEFIKDQLGCVNKILSFIKVTPFKELEPVIAGAHFKPKTKWLWYLYTKIPYRIRRAFRILLRTSKLKNVDIRKNSEQVKKEPMDNAVRLELIQFFKPYNQKLQAMVPFDISLWDE